MLAPPETTDDDRIVAKCYAELGYVTKEKGEYDESLRYHRRSMEIFERIDDALSVADGHLNIADVYKAKGELKQAMCEYEKGLNLYEDVFVEDPTKNSDSGTDVSLNSSSFSDLQHARALSKSDETLPHSSILDQEKRSSPSSTLLQSNEAKHASTTSLNALASSTKLAHSSEDVSLMGTSTEHHFRTSSENDINQFFTSLPSSHSLDVEQLSPSDDIFEMCVPLLYSPDEFNHELPETNFNSSDDNHQPDNSLEHAESGKKEQSHNVRHWLPRLSIKQLLIIIPSVFLVGALLWTTGGIAKTSLVPQRTDQRTMRSVSSDDLSEQLRKILAWRNDQMMSLSKATKRSVEEFVRSADSRSKMTVDKFQRLLETLDLKIVLVPR